MCIVLSDASICIMKSYHSRNSLHCIYKNSSLQKERMLNILFACTFHCCSSLIESFSRNFFSNQWPGSKDQEMPLQIQTMPVSGYCELAYSLHKPFISLHSGVCSALFLEAGWGSSSARHFQISFPLCAGLSGYPISWVVSLGLSAVPRL